jgi:hypothetical protein
MHLQTEMNAEIKNWNSRTEGKGKNKVMAGDIKVTANMPVSAIKKIMVDKHDFDFMYKANGDLKQFCFDEIPFFREFPLLDMFIETSDDWTLDLPDVKVKNISAKFLPGKRIDLTFTAQVHVDEETSGHIHAAAACICVKVRLQSVGGQKDLGDVE